MTRSPAYEDAIILGVGKAAAAIWDALTGEELARPARGRPHAWNAVGRWNAGSVSGRASMITIEGAEQLAELPQRLDDVAID